MAFVADYIHCSQVALGEKLVHGLEACTLLVEISEDLQLAEEEGVGQSV